MSVSVNFHHDFGLANRLFIFSAAYSYSKKHGKSLVFLKDFYHGVTIHSRIDYKNIFFSDIPIEENVSINQKYNDKLFFKYDEIPFIEGNVLLLGCFQSEKYFQEYKFDIYNRFSCPRYIIDQLQQLYKNLSNSCFIHVRRGDYTLLKKYDLNLFSEYYPQTIEKIRNQFPNVFFQVLSNDISWCEQNEIFRKLKDENILDFIDCNEVIGLWLMQCCKYGGICANSTYSWWGGWLNRMTNEKSIVYFPSRIINDNENYTDLVSDMFEVIDV